MLRRSRCYHCLGRDGNDVLIDSSVISLHMRVNQITPLTLSSMRAHLEAAKTLGPRESSSPQMPRDAKVGAPKVCSYPSSPKLQALPISNHESAYHRPQSPCTQSCLALLTIEPVCKPIRQTT